MIFQNPELVPPAPIKIKNELLERYVNLFKGLRSREDPISWRTFIIETKVLLGSQDPEHHSLRLRKLKDAKKILNVLLKGTYLESLKSEALISLGFGKLVEKSGNGLDILLINAHHTSEPLLWSLADILKRREKKVAVINPVGHYSDKQIRILSPGKFVRKIKRVIIIASTQFVYRGSLTVLSNVIRLIRNPSLAKNIETLDIVIPMFGGSRGHRIGQLEEIGYEVLEMIINPKILALMTRDLINQLSEKYRDFNSEVTFYSIDIHNSLFPARVFNRQGFEFVDILPSQELAKGCYQVIEEQKLLKCPIKVICCDKGAMERAESLTYELLTHPKNSFHRVQIVYLKKERKEAGVVSSVKIVKLVEWRKKKDQIIKVKLPLKRVDYNEYLLIYSDDLIDTGGTAKRDMEIISSRFPNARYKIFTASHPVLSKGLGVLDTLGANVFLLGNTLRVPGLNEHPKVRSVDFAPAVLRNLR